MLKYLGSGGATAILFSFKCGNTISSRQGEIIVISISALVGSLFVYETLWARLASSNNGKPEAKQPTVY